MIKSFSTGSFPAGLVLARVITGILLLRVGWEIQSTDKMSGYVQWLTDIHFPMPATMAYAGKLAELAGGLSFVIGFFVRWTSIPVMITMAVITFILGDGNFMSDSFLLLLLAWVFFCKGAGIWSLDNKLFSGKKSKPITLSVRNLFLTSMTLASAPLYGQLAEPWINKPFAQWPKIALVNEFNFKDGSRYDDTSLSYVGTSFLIRTQNDTYAVTVKHALFVAWRKFENKVSVNGKLDRWIMYPKNDKKNYIEVGPLVNDDPDEKIQDGYQNGVLQRDWLVFRTTSIPSDFYPLTIKTTTAQPGDQVYLTGNPYHFKHTFGLTGEILKKEGNLLLVQFDVADSIFLGGASGSPLLDRNGQLIGIFSNTRMDPVSGKKIYLINSINYLMDILHGKKPLNQNLVPVSAIVDSLVTSVSVQAALVEFHRLYADPLSYNTINLSWPDYPALRLTGEKLLDKLQFEEAIRYFKGLLEQYPWSHFFIKSLVKAYQLSGEHSRAKQVLIEALKHAEPFIKEEYHEMLKEIEKY